MIIFLYPGVEIGLNEKLPENMILVHSDKFWWEPDISNYNWTYIRDFASQIEFYNTTKKIVLAECQPIIREYIYNHNCKRTAIIFPSENLKQAHLYKMQEYMNKFIDKPTIYSYYFKAIQHIQENFEYDIRAIMYEAGYNRNWYDIAYAIKDENYNLMDIINKIQGELN